VAASYTIYKIINAVGVFLHVSQRVWQTGCPVHHPFQRGMQVIGGVTDDIATFLHQYQFAIATFIRQCAGVFAQFIKALLGTITMMSDSESAKTFEPGTCVNFESQFSSPRMSGITYYICTLLFKQDSAILPVNTPRELVVIE
jgi:hypothetical protein